MAAKPSVPLNKLNLLASVKQEPLQSPPSLPPPEPIPEPLAAVKVEPQQHEQEQQPREEEKQPPQKEEPHFLKSINDLATFSSAIQAFTCRFEELKQHLDFINQAIDSKFDEPQQEQRPQIETQPPPKSTETDNKTEKTGPQTPPKSSRSEIQSLCEMMCSKGLRKYIAAHLSNVSKLREEVPAALKLAPKPAKLVLDCIGRFFLQGIKAYTKDSPMIPARQASVLVLEFFLLMMGGIRGEGEVRIAADVKMEAEKGALAWRKRLIGEGGLAKASEVDARGLLLFVACYGIPKMFRSEDLGYLLRLCNLRAISDALKGSRVLPAKMPDIIEGMARNGMYVEAVDVASIFGLQDKFSLNTIFTLFLQESEKTFNKARQEAQNSPMALRKANENHLGALKMLVQYLEDRSADVAKLLVEWKIEEKIVKLEEENAELQKRIEEKKIMPKRKLDEVGSSSKGKSEEIKRSRFAAKGSPLPKSSYVNGLHEQRTATLADGMRPCDGLVAKATDSSMCGHVSNYPAASGSYPENGFPEMAGIGGVGSSNMVAGIGVPSASSHSGAHVDMGVDKAEQVMSRGGLPYGWRQGSVGQSASMRFGGLFGTSSIEGFAGLPDLPSSGATDRTTADLYRFVDSVVDNESYSGSSHRSGTLPNVVPVRHSSYVYYS